MALLKYISSTMNSELLNVGLFAKFKQEAKSLELTGIDFIPIYKIGLGKKDNV